MLYVNGKEVEFRPELSLIQLMEELGYDTKRIAVERNQEIIPKAQYESTMLEDGDHLEVVRFVGGG
ncbi:MAG: sulfur carrier protein ThiS [Ruminococcus sp.]